MKNIIFLFIVAVVVNFKSTVCSPQKCCKNDNNLINKKCEDGSNITNLNCDVKYSLKDNLDLYYSDPLDYLITDYDKIPPDQYCFTKKNGTPIYIVCFIPEDNLQITGFIINSIFLFISAFFLFFTIIIYLITPNILDLQGICILHAISGLAISFLALASNIIIESKDDFTCLFTAYLIYFSPIYAFFWLNILSFHIWRSVVKPKLLNKRFLDKHWTKIYHLYACSIPTALLIFLIMVHHDIVFDIPEYNRPGFGENKCWFKNLKGQFMYFYGPISIVLLLNLIFYAWTIFILWKKLNQSNETKTKLMKYRLLLCIRLFFVMGIIWFFEILSAALYHYPNYSIFCMILDFITSIQGVIIFLILVVFRKKVLKNLANRTICGKRLPGRWRNMKDDECEEIEEEYDLSEYTRTSKT